MRTFVTLSAAWGDTWRRFDFRRTELSSAKFRPLLDFLTRERSVGVAVVAARSAGRLYDNGRDARRRRRLGPAVGSRPALGEVAVTNFAARSVAFEPRG